MHTLIAYTIPLSLVLAGLTAIWVKLWKKSAPDRNLWKYAVYISLAMVWVFLGMVLMSSWIKGDDWRNIAAGNLPLGQSLRSAFHVYFSFVSRIGDFIIYTFGQSRMMWQNYVLTPLMAAMAPLAFHRLCRKGGETIYSARGLLFYWFVLSLCLIGVYTNSWRNYWCWSAVLNYLFPSLVAVYFVSHYRVDELDKQGSGKTCALLFICGAVAGWGTECLSAGLCGLMVLWAVLACMGKIPKWGVSRCCGALGLLLGATMLFASPALQGRSDVARSQMQLKVTELCSDEIHVFLANLNWESIAQLRGAGGIVFLGDFSMLDRLKFLPFLSERFLECCWRSSIAIAILLVIFLFVSRYNKRTCLIMTSGVLFAYGMAASYIYSCIPSHMSFLPPCFALIAVAAYLFVRLEKRYAFAAPLAIVFTVWTAYLIVPSAVEAWRYKKYELGRFRYIDEQKAKGNLDIVLPYPYEKEPEDKLGLIKSFVAPTSDKSPNVFMAEALKVRSVIQTPKQ